MGWLLELLFESVNEMCSKFIVDMMDLASGMFTEILSCDLDLFEELFGVAGDLYRNAVVPMGLALLLMILVWQLFKSMFGRMGIASEDPVELVLRSCICMVMILFAKDLVNYLLEIGGTPYDWVMGTVITVESFSEYVTAAEGVMSSLGVDVLTISILKLLLQLVVAWNYFKMLFILAERYVLLGIFSYTSPLAFAAGGSKATNNILASWSKMFGGQILVVILDAWCVKMFLSAYGNMMSSTYGFTKFFAANMCLIGFCKIMTKLDSYMGSLGVNLGRISSGMSGMGALLMAGRLANFGGGRRNGGNESGGNGNSGGHMNFGSGKTIPMGNEGMGFGENGMSGGMGQPGGGIGGFDGGPFGGEAPEFVGNEDSDIPFGTMGDGSSMATGEHGTMGPEGMESFGAGIDPEPTEPFGTDMNLEPMEPFGSDMNPEPMEPFGTDMNPEPMEPFGSDTEPEVAGSFGSAMDPETMGDFGSDMGTEPADSFNSEIDSEVMPPFTTGDGAASSEGMEVFGSGAESEDSGLFGLEPEQENMEPFGLDPEQESMESFDPEPRSDGVGPLGTGEGLETGDSPSPAAGQEGIEPFGQESGTMSVVGSESGNTGSAGLEMEPGAIPSVGQQSQAGHAGFSDQGSGSGITPSFSQGSGSGNVAHIGPQPISGNAHPVSEPFGQGMSLNGNGVPMQNTGEAEGYESMPVPDMSPDQTLEGAMGNGIAGLSEMPGETAGSGINTGGFSDGNSVGADLSGFTGGMGDFEGEETGGGVLASGSASAENIQTGNGTGGHIGLGTSAMETIGAMSGSVGTMQDSGGGEGKSVFTGTGFSHSGGSISGASEVVFGADSVTQGLGNLSESGSHHSPDSMGGSAAGIGDGIASGGFPQGSDGVSGSHVSAGSGMPGNGTIQSQNSVSGSHTSTGGRNNVSAGNGMAGGYVSNAGNADGTGYRLSGSGGYAASPQEVYWAERDGQGYMRYDTSRFERPQGDYQTIHENGKSYYELPETAQAPAVLPETRATLEKDGTLRVEKIYSGQRQASGDQSRRADFADPMRRPEPTDGQRGPETDNREDSGDRNSKGFRGSGARKLFGRKNRQNKGTQGEESDGFPV